MQYINTELHGWLTYVCIYNWWSILILMCLTGLGSYYTWTMSPLSKTGIDHFVFPSHLTCMSLNYKKTELKETHTDIRKQPEPIHQEIEPRTMLWGDSAIRWVTRPLKMYHIKSCSPWRCDATFMSKCKFLMPDFPNNWLVKKYWFM